MLDGSPPLLWFTADTWQFCDMLNICCCSLRHLAALQVGMVVEGHEICRMIAMVQAFRCEAEDDRPDVHLIYVVPVSAVSVVVDKTHPGVRAAIFEKFE